MRILLTNDDGFGAQGIETLYSVLSKEHEVYIVAPSGNRSGASACFTIFNKMEFVEKGNKLYTFSGSPVDCVMAVFKCDAFKEKPDLVISGINHGANIGSDTIYSGTVGAARQGALYGIPSIAVSLEESSDDSREKYDFKPLAEFIAHNLNPLIALCGKDYDEREGFGKEFFVNVNAVSGMKYKGVKFAVPCSRQYDDILELTEENGRMMSELKGHGIKSTGPENNDNNVIQQGYISITRLYTNPVCNNDVAGDFEKSFVL